MQRLLPEKGIPGHALKISGDIGRGANHLGLPLDHVELGIGNEKQVSDLIAKFSYEFHKATYRLGQLLVVIFQGPFSGRNVFIR